MFKNNPLQFLTLIIMIYLSACTKKSYLPDKKSSEEQASSLSTDKYGPIKTKKNKYKLSNKQLLNWSNIKSHNQYFPDGGITRFKVGSKWRFTMSGSTSYIYEGENIWPENASIKISEAFGQQQYNCNPDNGGKWLNNIEQLDDENNLVGFYHVEDHWCKEQEADDNRYWASIGVVYSNDGGKTFKSLGGSRNEGYIIKSSKPKPSSKTFGGAGNGHVFKGQDGNWYAIYSEYEANANNYVLHIARSTNYFASPGTWKKYYKGSFTTNALHTNGLKTALKNGHGFLLGANPFVQWNHKIKKYVMVYHKWGGTIRCATSPDLIHWGSDREIIGGHAYYEYPSLMSSEENNTITDYTRLYYSRKASEKSIHRNFEVQTLSVW
ncbi:hypothetical protein [Tenacibaculum sp. C7A-26P2]|uniref:hypothetical protein n=1 Tax=Tenacibaculum sp. C7A-26P2 TaxID=3447504 RepID=UPI003F85A096